MEFKMPEECKYMVKDVDPMMPISMFWIECDDGWHELIRNTLIKIAKIDSDKSVRIAQIKEKYGNLRIYLDYETDEIYHIIMNAESESEKTCEICGKPGKLKNNGGWVKTVCLNHANAGGYK